MNKYIAYQVLLFWEARKKWVPVRGALGQRGYVQGWFHGLSSSNPYRSYRMVRADGTVIEEWNAKPPPKPEEEERLLKHVGEIE